jgi:acyl-CoA reductase-like NAD-dependent aldehyde dehydrogenase
VAAAREAFSEWRSSPLAIRTRVLFGFRELVDSHRDDLAAAITAEHGKTLADAAGEVARGLDVVELACGIPHLLKGDVLRERLHARRHLLAAPAGRRGRWRHAFQLPGDGADVDVPARHRVRELFCA